MHERLIIRTPEGVSFEHELASVATRAMAWLVDLFITSVLLVLVVLGTARLITSLGGLGTALTILLAFVVNWGYGAGLEWAFRGRTPGKMLLGLRVVDERGLPITFLQAAIRNLVRLVDLLPGLYGVGGVSVLLDAKARRLGDLAAGTLVVRERQAPRPASFLLPGERHNSLASDPAVQLSARRITPPEREIVLALSLRREQLPLAVRRELFEALADHLSRRLRVERPSFFSGEKFVVQIAALAVSSDPSDARPPSP